MKMDDLSIERLRKMEVKAKIKRLEDTWNKKRNCDGQGNARDEIKII